ncbi:MAG: 5'/3'-nucleotidase SurE [Chloroflexi bacterium]|nr:5'/3'-nucleotidase SurE [Chloroflexota bacterium]
MLSDVINSNGFWETALKILVSNDDGVYADGLWALAKELREIATVTVVAPDRDQSGAGTSVTLRQPLRMIEIKTPLDGVAAYSVEGSPADSVILALRLVLKDSVDLIVSGINEGPNLGDDVYISGTVGAALQGFFYGIPALAFSIAAFGSLHFDVAARLARLIAKEIVDKGLSRRMLLNINLPNLPPEKLEGIEITRLGERRYADRIEPGHDGKRQYHWILRGKSEWQTVSGTDIWALQKNKISITPLFGNPDGFSRELLKSLAPALFQKLVDDTDS